MVKSSTKKNPGALLVDVVDPETMRLHAGAATSLLKTVGNEQRLMILCFLSPGERSVGALNSQLDLGQSALSQHLAVLRKAGLVATRRDAQTIYYSLTEGPAQRIVRVLHEIYCPGS